MDEETDRRIRALESEIKAGISGLQEGTMKGVGGLLIFASLVEFLIIGIAFVDVIASFVIDVIFWIVIFIIGASILWKVVWERYFKMFSMYPEFRNIFDVSRVYSVQEFYYYRCH